MSNTNTEGYAATASSSTTAGVISNQNHDLIVDLKSEFYTREGLWKQIPYCEYTKLTQSQLASNQQQPNSSNTMVTTSNNSTITTTTTTSSTTTTSATTGTTSNQNTYTCLSTQINNDPVKISLLSQSSLINNKSCDHCLTSTNIDNKTSCKYCNSNNSKSNAINMEFIVFNYCKEIFIYYYNSLKQVSFNSI